MLFRVSFWNDRADTEVFGKTIEAENECEAEGIFFDELEEENDYSDEYPVLVQETKEKPVKLDFEDLFCKALTELVESNGGSLNSALYDMEIQFESKTGKAIRDWFGWEDINEEDNHSELPWDYGKHFE